MFGSSDGFVLVQVMDIYPTVVGSGDILSVGTEASAVRMEQHEAAAAAYVRWIFSFHFLQALLLFAQVHLLLVAPCPPSVAVYL